MKEPSAPDPVSNFNVSRPPFWRRPSMVGVLVVTAVFALYLPTLSHPFVFDDVPELVQNPDVLSLKGCLETVSHSQNTGLSGRPAACLTFWANVKAADFSVRGFHLVNILIHALAACTLYGIVRRSFNRIQPAAGEISVFLAGLIALLWAVHPLQTESVTYVIQRIESLAGLWFLLTVYSAIRSWDCRKPTLWGFVSFVGCAAGMLTKETMVTAPLIVLLYDKVFLAHSLNGMHRSRRRLHIALACTWAIPILLNVNSPRGTSAGLGLGVSVLDNLRTQAGVILYYLRLSFWPFPQAISYSDWPIVREWLPALAPGLAIITLLTVSVIGLIRRTWWGFCGAWFFLILAPSSSFIPIVTEPAAERRMYLPLAAVVVVCFFAVYQALRVFVKSPKIKQATGLALSLSLISYLSAATFLRNAQYATVESILTSTLNVRPGDELVRGALLDEFIYKQRIDEARSVLEGGLVRNPRSFLLYDNWARAMNNIGRHDDAARFFSKAIEIRPDHYPSLSGMGISLLATGQYTKALPYLQRASQIAPKSHSIRGNLAVALEGSGQIEAAIEELRTALTLKPTYAEGHYNLARILESRGQIDEAIQHFEIASKLRPDDTEFQEKLEAALRTKNHLTGSP